MARFLNGFIIFNLTIASLLLLATIMRGVLLKIIASSNKNRVVCGTEMISRVLDFIVSNEIILLIQRNIN